MKIITSKLNKAPFHSICAKDIKFIFDSVPESWTRYINKVVLSPEFYKNSRFDRPAFGNAGDQTFKILSRGFTKEEIAKEILIELAVQGSIIQTQWANHIPKSELKKQIK